MPKTKKSSVTGDTVLYGILLIFHFIGTLPYKIPSFIIFTVISFVNLFFLIISSIAALILLTGVIIAVISKFVFKNILHGIAHSYQKIKKGFTITRKTAYKYKVPLFTPIIFFTILYLVMTFMGNVTSQEKKQEIMPESVKIYDTNHKVLYNGSLNHIEEARYIRSRELVEQVAEELRTNPDFNIINKDSIIIYLDGQTIKHIYTLDGKRLYGSRFDFVKPSFIQKQSRIASPIPESKVTKSVTPITPTSTDTEFEVTVKENDSFWEISKRACKTGKYFSVIQDLNTANPDFDGLHVGDKVKVKCSFN